MSTAHNAEDKARRRYIFMNLVRFAALGCVMAGIAIAQGAISGPWALGAALAFGGLGTFFYGPRRLARRWRAVDDADDKAAEADKQAEPE